MSWNVAELSLIWVSHLSSSHFLQEQTVIDTGRRQEVAEIKNKRMAALERERRSGEMATLLGNDTFLVLSSDKTL